MTRRFREDYAQGGKSRGANRPGFTAWGGGASEKKIYSKEKRQVSCSTRTNFNALFVVPYIRWPHDYKRRSHSWNARNFVLAAADTITTIGREET